jgi:hypothetical protein
MITKFNSASAPSFVREGEYQEGVPAWWVTVENNEYRLFDGDYIAQDDNGVPVRYVSAADYAADLELQNIIREEVGRDLIRTIWAALLASGLTDAQKVGVANKIAVVLVMIDGGQITAGRFLADTITTDANFTAGIKTALLGFMDEAIAKL